MKWRRFIALENNLKVLKVTFQVDNYSSSMIDKQFNVISQWTMGESLSMQISIDRYTLRCEVFIKKPIQRGLQRWAETRNRFAVALLAIASRHSTARCLRDAERNYPRHGIVSTSMKRRMWAFDESLRSNDLVKFVCTLTSKNKSSQ